MANARPKTTIHMGASKFTLHMTVPNAIGWGLQDLRRASYKTLGAAARSICKAHGITNIPKAVSDSAAQMARGM